MFAALRSGSSSVSRDQAIQGALFGLAGSVTAELVFAQFANSMSASSSLGRISVCALSLYILHRFAVSSFRSYKPTMKDLSAITIVLMVAICVVGAGRLLGLSLANYLQNSHAFAGVRPDSFEFAIPFAAGGLLLQAVFGMQYGAVFGMALATIETLYNPDHPLFGPYALVSVLVSCLSLSTFRSRSAYLRAGVKISFISLPFAIASVLIDANLHASDVIIRVAGALASGVFSAVLAAGFIPLLEHLGGYVTDLRLIEMATLDHPLLKELSVQCPGTWNHSMVMGMMVEAAADAIKANPVLSRVGAYFHDIGKIKKPIYFVENQQGEENRHDKLSSSMSALIIRSHVKDGLELAEKHGLPIKITDMIPQHHGTSKIEFFYDQACKEAEEAGEDPTTVDVNLYSYPGPKPQTREAGILMLADGTEAASRSLQDPSFDRIQGLVQKMINKVFASGELDQCELTLKDLHSIAKAFTRVLSGIYHQRIAYAEPAEKVHEKKDSEETEATTDETVENRTSGKDKKIQPEEGEGDEERKEDLKRLGL